MPTDSASTTQVTGLIPVVSPSDLASIALSSVPGDSIAVGTHGGEKRESQEGVVVRVAVDCSLLFIHERLVANSADKPDLQSFFSAPEIPVGIIPAGTALVRLDPSDWCRWNAWQTIGIPKSYSSCSATRRLRKMISPGVPFAVGRARKAPPVLLWGKERSTR